MQGLPPSSSKKMMEEPQAPTQANHEESTDVGIPQSIGKTKNTVAEKPKGENRAV